MFVQISFKLDRVLSTFLGFAAMILAFGEFEKFLSAWGDWRNSFHTQELATA
jgi:hypothetical protein